MADKPFDPDEYLANKPFDPDAFLREEAPAPIVGPPPSDPVAALVARETAARRLAQGARSQAKAGGGPGEIENQAEAAAFGAGNAATIGMMNRALGGIDYLRGGSPSYSEGVDKVAAHEAELQAKYPAAHIGGSLIGGVGTGIGLARSPLAFSRAGATIPQRIGMGALEGGAFGAAQGAGQTYSGNLPDYVKNAIIGGGFGVGGGAAGEAIGAGAGSIYGSLRDRGHAIFPEPVLRGARADVQGLENLPRLGPDAMLPDAGPSMQSTAQQAALGIGENRSTIVNALMERDLGTVPRLRTDVEAAIGPVPRVSKIGEELDANRVRINKEEYTPRLAGQVLPPAETNAAMEQLRALQETSRVNLSGVQDRLLARGVGPNRSMQPDRDPQAWLAARHHVDDLITEAQAKGRNYETSVLMDTRKIIDGHLARNVPGIKQADAIQQANTIAKQELERGGTILDTGKRALPPADLRDLMQVNAIPRGEAPSGPPSANLRLRQGTRAELDRRIGTVGKEANALPKLEGTLGDPGGYNALKMEEIFGAPASQAVRDSVARNRQFRETYHRIAKGSDTAQREAAAKTADISAPQMPIRNVAGTVEQAGRWGLAQVQEAQKQAQREAIARIMALRDPDAVEAARQLLLHHARQVAPGTRAVNQTGRGVLQGTGSVLGPAYEDYTR